MSESMREFRSQQEKLTGVIESEAPSSCARISSEDCQNVGGILGIAEAGGDASEVSSRFEVSDDVSSLGEAVWEQQELEDEHCADWNDGSEHKVARMDSSDIPNPFNNTFSLAFSSATALAFF